MVDPISRNMSRDNGYDPNLWTLPSEFDCSMVIFLYLAAFSRLRPRIRLFLNAALILYCNYYVYWRIMLFASGMFLCDLHFHLDSTADPPKSVASPAPLQPDEERELTLLAPPATSSVAAASSTSRHGSPTFHRALWTMSFILTLYVLSMPEIGRGGANSPGYITLANMIPAQYINNGLADYFWIPLASIWLVFTIDWAPHLQAIFARPLPQYLGKISYSLYLIHGPLLWSWGRWAAMTFVGWTGRETSEMYCFGIFLSVCVFWPVAIVLADLVWRCVDAKAVEFSRVAYEWLLVRKDGDRDESAI